MFPKTSFGQFIDGNRAYRITNAFPPKAMLNVLSSLDGYLAEVSHWGTGTASLRFPDGELNQIVLSDQKTLYCRDEDSGDVWCPGVYPMMSKVSRFVCEHHPSHTSVASTRHGIRVNWRYFIPLRGFREIWTVTLENRTDRERRISLVPVVRLQLDGFKAIRFFGGQEGCGTCGWRDDVDGLYFQAGNPQAHWPRYNAVLGCSVGVESYSGSTSRFLGAPMDLRYPEVLVEGRDLGNSDAVGGPPFQAIQTEVVLPPKGSARVDFVFGVVEGPKEAAQYVREIRSSRRVEALFDETRDATNERRSSLTVRTPDPKVDAFANFWLKKGLEYALLRKDATRDNLQFADGLVMSETDVVRAELLRGPLRWQFADGNTLRSWVPVDKTKYGDGPLWYFLAVCGYLKFSDDLGFLDERVPFFDEGEGTVREHLERALARLDADRGPHGLNLAHFGDWNDALNLADPRAESVFVTLGHGFALKEMAELLRYLGESDAAEEYATKHAALKQLVNDVAWDEEGGYYVRAFADGKVLGARRSEGSKVFLNPQSWAILADMVPPDRLSQILKVVDEVLETDYGCALAVPPYQGWDPRLGRISVEIPGSGENGGVYCHATGFKIMADTLVGRGDAALRCLLKLLPDHELNPVEHSGAAPYALTSLFNIHPANRGRAGRHWITGTQTWVLNTIVEGLLGVRRAYGGFRIAPAFPSSWDEASVMLLRKGDSYRFHIAHKLGSSKDLSVALDGRGLSEPFVPFQSEGTHEVEITIG